MSWVVPQLVEQKEAFLDTDVSNVTDTNCTDGVQWIYKVLGDCVINTQGILSDVCGMASILCWMVVSIPQMVKNCRNIRGVEGVSLGLILQWTLGDTTNLIGSILTKQLILQVYLAVYFVFADLVLFSQFIYYHIWQWKQRKDVKNTTGPSRIVLCFAGAFLSMNVMGMIYGEYIFRPYKDQYRHHPAGRNLLHIEVFHNLKDEFGYAIGIVSSIFYVGSRTAQLYKNYKRKSTEGLSLLMFWLAILGNLTYGLSILVRDLSEVFLIRHIPWLVGSLGVIFLDSSLVIQFKYYGSSSENDPSLKQSLIDNEVTVENGVPNYQSVDSSGTIN